MQDVGVPRSAQPHLQGDLRLPGGAVPAVGGDAAPVRLQPPQQHEAERASGLGDAGPQQRQRGAGGALEPHEGVGGAAGVPVAHPPGHLNRSRDWGKHQQRSEA